MVQHIQSTDDRCISFLRDFQELSLNWVIDKVEKYFPVVIVIVDNHDAFANGRRHSDLSGIHNQFAGVNHIRFVKIVKFNNFDVVGNFANPQKTFSRVLHEKCRG